MTVSIEVVSRATLPPRMDVYQPTLEELLSQNNEDILEGTLDAQSQTMFRSFGEGSGPVVSLDLSSGTDPQAGSPVESFTSCSELDNGSYTCGPMANIMQGAGFGEAFHQGPLCNGSPPPALMSTGAQPAGLLHMEHAPCNPTIWSMPLPPHGINNGTLAQGNISNGMDGVNQYESGGSIFMSGVDPCFSPSRANGPCLEGVCGQMNGFSNGLGIDGLLNINSGRFMQQMLGRKRTSPPGLRGMLAGSLLDDVAVEAKAKLEAKRVRRMESNRASARRSRQRKADSLDTLHRENMRLREEYIPHILQERAEMEKKLKESEKKIRKVEKENLDLAEQIKQLTKSATSECVTPDPNIMS